MFAAYRGTGGLLFTPFDTVELGGIEKERLYETVAQNERVICT
jgi:hypothetical protein